MARKFITTNIIDPVKAPFSKRSLEHVNTAFDELTEQLIKTFYSGYNTNDILILKGCTITANIPGTSSITAGTVYYNGRIYSVDANASISTPANTLVWQLVTTYASGDPATFSDGNTHNFHEIQKMTVVNAVSGTGLADYNGGTIKYYNYFDNLSGGEVKVTISGNIVTIGLAANCGTKTSGQTIFTIPAAYRSSTAITTYTSLITYTAGGGSAQQGNCIGMAINTQTGVCTAILDMAAGHDIVVGQFSYYRD